MSALEAKFEVACSDARNMTRRPPDAQLLEIYSLYKQATVGDVNIPGTFVDPIKKAKWLAWSEKKGMSRDEAKKKYVSVIEEIAGARNN